MTGTQYKNIIENTLLDESLEEVTDSVMIARAVFDNCGVPLPHGNCSEIMSALASDDFVGWRKCTLEEAQEHANNGIAAIGISNDRILIIEPQEEGVISSNLPETATYSSTMVTADSFSQVDDTEMIFYADTMATTTVEDYFRIIGRPTNNRMEPQQTEILFLESNLPDAFYYTTWSSSNPTVATVQSIQPPKAALSSHFYGRAIITATSSRYGTTDSFTLEVSTYKIIGKPINDIMITGETKTINIESNLSGVDYDTIWSSSNPSVATVSPRTESGSTVITTLSSGSTYISASSPMNARSDGFTLTVEIPQIKIGEIAGVDIYEVTDSSGKYIYYKSMFAVDADGSPRAYHPTDDSIALDYLANAGRPGNWWALACDGNGNPYIQNSSNPCPGFYVSTTSKANPGYADSDPRRYVDSETIAYVAIPLALNQAPYNVFMGSRCIVTNILNGKVSDAIVADVGNNSSIGEGSIKLAENLGINKSPKHGGTWDKVIEYRFYR